MTLPHFAPLRVSRVDPEAAGAAVLSFAVPPDLRTAFAFAPGQFLTLRADVGGRDLRRSYSICSTPARFERDGTVCVAIKPVAGGQFSTWATQHVAAGDVLQVMPPDGRFTSRLSGAGHRVLFGAGSGITPLLSIAAHTLAGHMQAQVTLVYANQRVATAMFTETLQDLKDRYPARFTLINVLSRQPQEWPLFNGRLDSAKMRELLAGPLRGLPIDEAFICGPEGMMDAVQAELLAAGVGAERVHTERFGVPGGAPVRAASVPVRAADDAPKPIALTVIIDGKPHALRCNPDEAVLDVAAAAGLDVPYACKAGVCCTCRARVLQGQVQMQRNFTLEAAEMACGFVLTCQARATTDTLVVSYDER